ncbi:uncharacterized protein BXZ73DRAFT_98290 [Epithele typhae]|uniref:uncharacterized protein n=1 Tax=Epithele typhae TaxID=378194 RepID=UPI002008017F|nr:uncharacterized protein BXZ73DRAFT_98290 [Epithele typhae]KAH9941901.1 hypothetical protein BXZ73DRAFT_98290 [Epithele typhae]
MCTNDWEEYQDPELPAHEYLSEPSSPAIDSVMYHPPSTSRSTMLDFRAPLYLSPEHVANDILPPPAHPQASQDVQPNKRIMGLTDRFNSAFFDHTATTVVPLPSPDAAAPVPSHTLVVAHLPKIFRRLDFLQQWATRFGEVARVVLDAKCGKALVEWIRPEDATMGFNCPRMHGDGKEHIRVYRYRGVDRWSALEMEEGEIDEEVSTKSKKKKNKAKKKLEQRLADPTSLLLPRPSPLPSIRPLPATSAPPTKPLTPHLSSPARKDRYFGGEGTWEDEMVLDSDDEGSARIIATLDDGSVDGELQIAAMDDDEDMEMSSPVESNTNTTHHNLAPVDEIMEVRDRFRRDVQAKAQLALRKAAPGPRVSLSSSDSPSESPEPITPSDTPSHGLARTTLGSLETKTANGSAGVGDELVVTHNPPSHPSTSLPSHSSTSPSKQPPNALPGPHHQRASPTGPAPLAVSTSAVTLQIPAPTPHIPLTEDMRVAKQKRWLELVNASTSILDKVQAAKVKEEKILLMRLLHAKTK